MNTLVHLIADFALVALTWWFFDQDTTMTQLAGIVALGLTLVFVAWTLQAAAEDVGDFKRSRE